MSGRKAKQRRQQMDSPQPIPSHVPAPAWALSQERPTEPVVPLAAFDPYVREQMQADTAARLMTLMEVMNGRQEVLADAWAALTQAQADLNAVLQAAASNPLYAQTSPTEQQAHVYEATRAERIALTTAEEDYRLADHWLKAGLEEGSNLRALAALLSSP